ncbi:MAG TPA: hypothetical protein PLV41_01835 [Miltoncostaeales bacterium]|nr:hypothetical protein [Miltoncostaeales bacterium]
MSTDRIRQMQQRPDLIRDDPGAWSIVSYVREAQGSQLIGRGGRRRSTPAGLLTDTAPDVPLPKPGLDNSIQVAGAGKIELVSVLREGARELHFAEGDTVLRGIHTRVIRRFSVPDLVPGPHEYPETDPAAAIPPPAHPAEIGQPVPGEVTAPGGLVAAVPIKYGRLFGLVLLRTDNRHVLRFIAGGACAAWTADAQMIAFAGDWGVMLARIAEPVT